MFGAGRVDEHTPVGGQGVGLRQEPVAAPLPDVAGHVVQAVAVGRERLHRRRALVSIFRRIFIREVALEVVALRMVFVERFVAPDVLLAFQAAARRALPLGLGRQAFAGPFGIGDGVVPGNLYDGVVVPAVDGAARSFRVAPVGPGLPLPPLMHVVQRHRMVRRRENEGTGFGLEVGRFRRAGWELLLEILPVQRLLGRGAVAGGLDEGAELGVGDVGLVHPEAVHPDAVGGTLDARNVGVVAAHHEFAAGNPAHPRRRRGFKPLPPVHRGGQSR